MNNSKIFTAFKTLFTFLLLISFTVACNNATSGEEDELHPDGFRLKLNGETVIEQLPDQSLTGEFNLATGEETDLITIWFLDHDGDEFQPEDDDYSLGYTIEDENVVVFEQHTEDGNWSFHLEGQSEGTTTLDLRLLHGNHSDFTANDIPVNVITVN